jgi:alkaline phosphatase D
VLVLLLCAAAAASAAVEHGGLLVAAGDVTATSAVLWTRGVRAGEVAVDVAPVGAAPSRRLTVPVRTENDLTGKLRLADLTPATRYRYRVAQESASAEGEFVTAPLPTEPARVRFLWSGDLGGGGFCRPVAGGYAIFR